LERPPGTRQVFRASQALALCDHHQQVPCRHLAGRGTRRWGRGASSCSARASTSGLQHQRLCLLPPQSSVSLSFLVVCRPPTCPTLVAAAAALAPGGAAAGRTKGIEPAAGAKQGRGRHAQVVSARPGVWRGAVLQQPAVISGVQPEQCMCQRARIARCHRGRHQVVACV
jgi:hypothetical protein